MMYVLPPGILAAALLTVPAGAAMAQANGSECLGWDRPVVLEGFLLSGLFPGPPNFTSVEGGDAPFTAQFLHLIEPICVAPDPEQDTPAIPSVEVVQIACPAAAFQSGQLITLSGTLFAPHTGYHHARLLLDCG